MSYVNKFLFQAMKQGSISYETMTEKQQLAMDELALGEITAGEMTQEEYELITGKEVIS